MCADSENRPLFLMLHLLRNGLPLTGTNEDDVIDTLITRSLHHADAEDWRMAIAEAMRLGYVYDPVRLEPGSLQCRWRLELTPQGFLAAQREQR